MNWDLHLDEYEKYLLSKDKSQKTIEKYRPSVEQMLEYIAKRPEEITQKDLDNYKIYLKQAYDQNSLSPFISGINHFFEMKDVPIKLKAPPKQTKNVIPLAEKEIKRLFIASKRDMMGHAILTTLYYSMLRNSELCNLNISDIDFEKRKLRVNNGKGGKSAVINLHPTALEAIDRYIDKKRKTPNDGSDALFVMESGNRLSRTPLDKIVKRFAIRAGITKRVYPHLFRHSCISHMSDNGATLPEIQRQSRHKNIETLMLYVHPNEQKAKEAYLKTVTTIDPVEEPVQEVVKQVAQKENSETNKDIAQKLTDALCDGILDKESYLKALSMLNLG